MFEKDITDIARAVRGLRREIVKNGGLMAYDAADRDLHRSIPICGWELPPGCNTASRSGPAGTTSGRSR
jgi:hypothetical protein